VHEQALRGLNQIRVERIIKNHAQLMALVDALTTIVPLTAQQHSESLAELTHMAIERQGAINADPQEVAEFWEVFEYLETISEDAVVNHSKNDSLIAINLNEFCERAAEHRQKLADIATLRNLLKSSRSRAYVESNKSVDSAVRAAFNNRNQMSPRCTTVKCWIFKKP
jgi:hypothetical protein